MFEFTSIQIQIQIGVLCAFLESITRAIQIPEKIQFLYYPYSERPQHNSYFGRFQKMSPMNIRGDFPVLEKTGVMLRSQ